MPPHRLVSLRMLLSLASMALITGVCGPAFADAAGDRVRATPGGGHSDWDAQVRLILLANYDLNDSMWLDRPTEIQAIPCDTWGALDEGVRAGWGASGLRQIYGFEGSGAWVGGELGFSEALRPQADARLVACEQNGFRDDGFAGPVADRIRGLSHQGGSDEWDAAVKSLLLEGFDADGSGSLDSSEELVTMPCDVYDAIDEGVRQRWPAGVRQTYGFRAGLSWVGGVLGFNEAVRSGADVRLLSCLGSTEPLVSGPAPGPEPAPGPGPTRAPAPTTTPSASTGSPHERIRQVPGGGSGAWDSEVGGILVEAYDANGSGWLDTGAEVKAVTCDDWRALDDGVKSGWGYGLRVIYGFHPDYSWVGDAIRFSESLRSVADTRLVGCLEGGGTDEVAITAPPTLTDPAGLIGAIPDGGTSEWDDKVREVLIAFYDTNGSGMINSKAEIGKIPCAVWGAMDAGIKERFTYGLRPIYGFEEGYSWIGGVLGFHDSVRKHGDKALQECGYLE